jgi:hypothetical protein
VIELRHGVVPPELLAFQGDDLAVRHEPVDHRGGDDVVTEDLALAAEHFLLLLTISEARS